MKNASRRSDHRHQLVRLADALSVEIDDDPRDAVRFLRPLRNLRFLKDPVEDRLTDFQIVLVEANGLLNVDVTHARYPRWSARSPPPFSLPCYQATFFSAAICIGACVSGLLPMAIFRGFIASGISRRNSTFSKPFFR